MKHKKILSLLLSLSVILSTSFFQRAVFAEELNNNTTTEAGVVLENNIQTVDADGLTPIIHEVIEDEGALPNDIQASSSLFKLPHTLDVSGKISGSTIYIYIRNIGVTSVDVYCSLKAYNGNGALVANYSHNVGSIGPFGYPCETFYCYPSTSYVEVTVTSVDKDGTERTSTGYLYR